MAASYRAVLPGPGFWLSLPVLGIGVLNVIEQAPDWPGSGEVASRIEFFLLVGVAAALVTGLVVGGVFWLAAHLFGRSTGTALRAGCVLGFNGVVVFLFWLMPAFI